MLRDYLQSLPDHVLVQALSLNDQPRLVDIESMQSSTLEQRQAAAAAMMTVLGAWTNQYPLHADVVDQEYIQFENVWSAAVDQKRILEIESFSPYLERYLVDNQLVPSEQWQLEIQDEIGLIVSRLMGDLVAVTRNNHLTFFIDDIHAPTHLTVAHQHEFFYQTAKLLIDGGVIRKPFLPGGTNDYIFLTESRLQSRIEALLFRLRQSDSGELREEDGNIVFYPNSDFVQLLHVRTKNLRQEFRKKGIRVVHQGNPTCAGFDASGYSSEANQYITHLVIVDDFFTSQQTKAYTLARAAGFFAADYHNIFFPKDQPADLVVGSMVHLLQESLGAYISEHLRG